MVWSVRGIMSRTCKHREDEFDSLGIVSVIGKTIPNACIGFVPTIGVSREAYNIQPILQGECISGT